MAAIVGSVAGSDKQHARMAPQGARLLLQHLEAVFAIAVLIGCILALHERFDGIGVVCVLTGALAVPVFSRAQRSTELTDKPLARVWPRIVMEWAGIVAVLLLLAFALKQDALFSRAVMLSWFTITPVALFAAHLIRNRASGLLAPAPGRYIIVGAGDAGGELSRHLPQRGLLGLFDPGSREEAQGLAQACDEIADFVRSHEVAAVYITLPPEGPQIGAVAHALRGTGAALYFVPDVHASGTIRARPVDLHGLPAIAVCGTPWQRLQAWMRHAAGRPAHAAGPAGKHR